MNNYVIETRNLTKQYETQKSVADLNIHVKRGRIYGLLGRNGAGKTTTMKMLLMDPECGVENGMSYHPLPAIFILLAIIGCSILLLAKKGRKPQILVATKKKRKTARKRGW